MPNTTAHRPSQKKVAPPPTFPAPGASPQPPLSPAERAHRQTVLADIETRVRKDGPHVARAHPDRARQFMPFAALKGYHELAAAQEGGQAEEEADDL